MERRIHIISGLPRSGSTLLSALLLQNPQFFASVSSPLYLLTTQVQALIGGRSEFHPIFDDGLRLSVLRALWTGYYDQVTDRPVIFDTNRWWCSKLPLLVRLLPNAKVVCCVRSVAWIMDSIERLLNRNELETSRIFNFDSTTNVYGRADIMNAPASGFIGASYSSLKEAFYGELSERLLLVRYETLVRSPQSAMAAIYDFIREKHFEHDFADFEFESRSYDAYLGMPGLHTTKGPVRWVERSPILPPDLFARYKDTDFWERKDANPRNVAVI